MKISLLVLSATAALVSAFDRQALGAWFTKLRPEKVVHAINCGSTEDHTDLLGVNYKADYGFIGGLTSDDGAQA